MNRFVAQWSTFLHIAVIVLDSIPAGDNFISFLKLVLIIYSQVITINNSASRYSHVPILFHFHLIPVSLFVLINGMSWMDEQMEDVSHMDLEDISSVETSPSTIKNQFSWLLLPLIPVTLHRRTLKHQWTRHSVQDGAWPCNLQPSIIDHRI